MGMDRYGQWLLTDCARVHAGYDYNLGRVRGVVVPARDDGVGSRGRGRVL